MGKVNGEENGESKLLAWFRVRRQGFKRLLNLYVDYVRNHGEIVWVNVFPVVLVAAVSLFLSWGLACKLHLRDYSVTVLAAAGVLIAIYSFANTLRLLQYQRNKVTDYNQLLQRLNRNFEHITKQIQKNENRRCRMTIFSPTPAIGNISGDLRLYNSYAKNLEVLASDDYQDRVAFRVVLNAHFSSWHKEFIRRRVEHLREDARDRKPKKAIDQLDKEFPPSLFNAISKFDDTYNIRKQESRDAVDRIRKNTCSCIESLGRKEQTAAENDPTVEKLKTWTEYLLRFAHRAADCQVLSLLGLIGESSTLVKSEQGNFTPCIAVCVDDSYYLTWIVKELNGTSNVLYGYSSDDPGTERIIGNLADHYEKAESERTISYRDFTDKLGTNEDYIKSSKLDDLLASMNPQPGSDPDQS